jgi:uncharacterized beta-barrel protein YwiB (DUF1934 family)
MESKCIVTLTTTTVSPGEEPINYELTTSGKLSKLKNGGYKIRYEDTSFDGLLFENELTANGERSAEIKRLGNVSSSFTLDVDKKHLCMINTPFGDISLGVITHFIKNELSQNGGALYLKYSLDADNNLISDNEVKLSVKI